MIIAFLDDSHPHGTSLLAIGGLMIDERYLLSLENDFLRVLHKFQVPVGDENTDVEVKWSAGRGNWIRDNIGDERNELFAELLDSMNDHGAVLLTSAFDYGSLKDWDEQKARLEAFTYAFERIHSYAFLNSTAAIVIIDSEGDKGSTKERVRQTLELVKSGSPYTSLKRIYRHAWAVDSKHHAGIQLADLVVGITSRMIAGDTKYASSLWQKLQGKFMCLENLVVPQRYGFTLLPSNKRTEFVSKHDPYGSGHAAKFKLTHNRCDDDDGFYYDEDGHAIPITTDYWAPSKDELHEESLCARGIPSAELSNRRNFTAQPPHWEFMVWHLGVIAQTVFSTDQTTHADWNFLMCEPAEFIRINGLRARVTVELLPD